MYIEVYETTVFGTSPLGTIKVEECDWAFTTNKKQAAINAARRVFGNRSFKIGKIL